MPRRATPIALSLMAFIGLQAGCNLVSPQLPSNNDGQDSGPSTNDVTGTDPVPSGTLGINGVWRQEATGSSPAYCITITNEQVMIFDDACDGTPLNIISSRASSYSATGIAVGVVVGESPASTEYTLYGFTLYPRKDGSMTGLIRIQSQPVGTLTSENITWIPQ